MVLTLACAEHAAPAGQVPAQQAWALTIEWRSEDALECLRRIEQAAPELLNQGLARKIAEELMFSAQEEPAAGVEDLSCPPMS